MKKLFTNKYVLFALCALIAICIIGTVVTLFIHRNPNEGHADGMTNPTVVTEPIEAATDPTTPVLPNTGEQKNEDDTNANADDTADTDGTNKTPSNGNPNANTNNGNNGSNANRPITGEADVLTSTTQVENDGTEDKTSTDTYEDVVVKDVIDAPLTVIPVPKDDTSLTGEGESVQADTANPSYTDSSAGEDVEIIVGTEVDNSEYEFDAAGADKEDLWDEFF